MNKHEKPSEKEFVDFDTIFEQYDIIDPPKTSMAHEFKNIQAKYLEIIDAVGIEKELLKGKAAFKDSSGKKIKGYFCVKDDAKLIAELIFKHKSADFKKLRSANYIDMNLAEVKYLIQTFLTILQNIGYSEEDCLKQEFNMEKRMRYKVCLAKEELAKQQEKIMHKIRKVDSELQYEDAVYFLCYMAEKTKQLGTHFDDVYSNYQDIRRDELDDMASDEVKHEDAQIAIARINKEIVFADALKKDKEYQKLMKKMISLIAEDSFMKDKLSRYKKIQEQMEMLRKNHQIELFGEIILDETDEALSVRHPLGVLQDAVEYTETELREDICRKEAHAGMSQEEIDKEERQFKEWEKWLKEKGQCTDLPISDSQEMELLLEKRNFQYKKEGEIAFPCCDNEKVIVFEGARGQSAIKCPQCGQYSLFDYKNMKAELIDMLPIKY